MSVEADMVTYILTESDITDIIENRIFPVFADHDPKPPYITYRREGTDRNYNHSGPIQIPTIRFSIICWDKEYDDAIALADIVRSHLNAGSGQTWGASSEVKISRIINEEDNFEPSAELLEKQFYGRELTLEFRVSET